ncbi:MBL fold metallo-hydrolase [Agromyces tardus]|uniref:MBL fold metallo-hydrolase n=1 Tax=Agromyces tardus TaxID=2583849 RepID=UPI0014859111|nr:MBL fold metallo-hydrolase [Agromyces tardus]
MAISTQPIDPAFPLESGADVTIWWLGQAGFALRHGDDLLFIDPYLSDVLADKYAGRLFPHRRLHDAPVAPAAVEGLSTVLCTHGHTDHMDLGAIPLLQTRSDPLFVIPRSETVKGIGRGIPPARLLGLDAGESFRTRAGVTITAVPAAHEEITVDEHGQNLFLGYVLDLGGYRIYHSGDCAPYPGQHELLRALDLDLALLPVNGRDAHRAGNGVPGNFHLEEAVELCRAAGIPRLVCHHWGLFAFNTAQPDDLRRRLADVDDVEWHIPELGAPFTVGRVLA